MDKVREYNQLKDEKKFFNKLNLDLRSLLWSEPDYEIIAEIIIRKVEEETGFSLSSEEHSYFDDFKVGDRFVGINDSYRIGDNRDISIKGLKGKIVGEDTDGWVGVEFEKDIEGHDCDGNAKDGHGWYLSPQGNLKKIIKEDVLAHPEIKNDYYAFKKDLADKVIEVSNGYKRREGEFELGDKVRVKKSVAKPKYGWGFTVTHDDVGVVSEINGENIKINFKGHSDWNACAHEMELVNSHKELSKGKVKNLVDKVVADVEAVAGLKDYELKRRPVVKQGVSKLRSFGYDDKYILDFFQERLNDVSDVEEALKCP